VPILVFPSTTVVTTLQTILSKISVPIMDSQFFISDITRQLPVQCGQWEAITVGSLHGLVVLAWVTGCLGVIYPLSYLKEMFGFEREWGELAENSCSMPTPPNPCTTEQGSKESFPSRILTVTPKSAGGTGGHSYTTSGLPSSLPRKDYGSIF
jgi:hypothetical protein